MCKKTFDYLINDSQGTNLEPIAIKEFCINEYADHEASLLENNKKFWSSKNGVAVYRHFSGLVNTYISDHQ